MRTTMELPRSQKPNKLRYVLAAKMALLLALIAGYGDNAAAQPTASILTEATDDSLEDSRITWETITFYDGEADCKVGLVDIGDHGQDTASIAASLEACDVELTQPTEWDSSSYNIPADYIADGIEQALASDDLDALSLSLAIHPALPRIEGLIKSAQEQNIPVFVAGGNSGDRWNQNPNEPNGCLWLAQLAGSYCVAGVIENTDAGTRSIDYTLWPGTNWDTGVYASDASIVRSDHPEYGYSEYGTSFATPRVAVTYALCDGEVATIDQTSDGYPLAIVTGCSADTTRSQEPNTYYSRRD